MKLKYNFIINELGDSFVGVPVSNAAVDFQGVLKFNKETAFIIELLNNEISYEDLCVKVKENFSISEEETKSNVDMILNKLRDAELIEE